MGPADTRNSPVEDERGDGPLEGDEGEVVIERHRDMGRAILETRIDEIRFAPAVTLPVDATVARAVALMRKKRIGALVVVEKKRSRRVVGIFTERDLMSCIERRGFARLALQKVMTRDPETLRPRDRLAYALNKMSVGRFRHVPLVDDAGKPAGMLSIRDVIDFMVEIIPEAVLNLPPQPSLEVHPTPEGD